MGIAAPTWAAIMIVAATLVGLILAVTRRDAGFVLVLVWAFIAIITKQAATPVITTTALITVIVLLVVLAGSIFFTIAGRAASQPAEHKCSWNASDSVELNKAVGA